MKKSKQANHICCFCFDKRSAIFVIAALALLHSIVNIALSIRLLTESNTERVYVVAMAIKTYGVSQSVKNSFALLTTIKLIVFTVHLLSSTTLITSVCCAPSAIYSISPIFICTEILSLLYTASECVFTIFHLNGNLAKALLSVVMVISILFMGWCSIVVTRFARNKQFAENRFTVSMIRRESSNDVLFHYENQQSNSTLKDISQTV